MGAQQEGEHRCPSGLSGASPPGGDLIRHTTGVRQNPSIYTAPGRRPRGRGQPSSTARTTDVAAPRSAAAAPSADVRTATGERHTTRRASSSATAVAQHRTQARVAAAEDDGGHVEQVHRPRERDAQRMTTRPQRRLRGGLAPGRGVGEGVEVVDRRGAAQRPRARPRARGIRGRRRCTAVRRGRRRRGPARPRGPRTRRTAARPARSPRPPRSRRRRRGSRRPPRLPGARPARRGRPRCRRTRVRRRRPARAPRRPGRRRRRRATTGGSARAPARRRRPPRAPRARPPRSAARPRATTSAASAAAARRPSATGRVRWPDAAIRCARTAPVRSTTHAPTASTPISTPSPPGPDRLSCSGLAGRPVAPRAAASSATSPAASSSSTSDDTVPRVRPVPAAIRARDTGSSSATVRSTRARLCRRTVCWPAGRGRSRRRPRTPAGVPVVRGTRRSRSHPGRGEVADLGVAGAHRRRRVGLAHDRPGRLPARRLAAPASTQAACRAAPSATYSPGRGHHDRHAEHRRGDRAAPPRTGRRRRPGAPGRTGDALRRAARRAPSASPHSSPSTAARARCARGRGGQRQAVQRAGGVGPVRGALALEVGHQHQPVRPGRARTAPARRARRGRRRAARRRRRAPGRR